MQKAWRGLRERWEITHDSWKDVDRNQFEREHMREFENTVGTYVSRLSILDDVTAMARREVP